mmetsp:Transcript_70151/g.227046  ORF Transcript_70151/g.227046 Transcript_70151/m.227046 type:complete len:531 (-) Transcript_70151:201-1793(-)
MSGGGHHALMVPGDRVRSTRALRGAVGPTAAAARVAAATPTAIAGLAAAWQAVLADVLHHRLLDWHTAFGAEPGTGLKASALSGVRGRAGAASIAAAAPIAIARALALRQALCAAMQQPCFAGSQVLARHVQQPYVVHQDFAPGAALRVFDADVGGLAIVAREAVAAVLEEGVGVAGTLRGAEQQAVAPAVQEEAGAPAGTTAAAEGDAVDALGQEEDRRGGHARAKVAPGTEVRRGAGAGHRGAGEGAAAGAAEGRAAHASPAPGAAARGGALEGQGELHPRRHRHLEVGNVCIARVAAAATLCATDRGVHPTHVGGTIAPVRDAQGHARGHGPREITEVVAALRVVLDHLATLLLQHRDHAREGRVGAVGVAAEGRAHGERTRSVDAIARSGAVDVAAHVLGVLRAAGAVALAVVPGGRWRVALVGRGLESVGVCLHDVDLGAPGTADLVGVAVVRAPGAIALGKAPVLAARGRLGEVKCQVAVAAHAAEVHCKTHGLAKELQRPETLRIPVIAAGGGDTQARVVVHR